ncbi:MAG: FkbM family methyltransferase [Caulobacterales bacterium]
MAKFKPVQRWIQRYSHRPSFRPLARLAESYRKAAKNLDYNFETNGERRIMEIVLAGYKQGDTIFDVGANIGDWCVSAAAIAPATRIYAFEPIPKTYQKLEVRCRAAGGVKAQNLALGEAQGEVTFVFSENAHELSTAVPGAFATSHFKDHQRVTCTTMRGDDFSKAAGVSAIRFLKIDTEGYEGSVLRGFGKMLENGAVKVIQFEYGRNNIHARFLLKDAYDLLSERYLIGKVYPLGVHFKDYDTHDEDFVGPNYVAVLRTESSLAESLRRQ